jgi:hypothetical protein
MPNDLISRTRRNHALEHASINVLSEKLKGFSAQGNSSPGGFNLNIFGDVSDEDVYDAVEDAYRRLKAGESRLALHPTCGTVLLTTAAMAALTAQASFALELKRQRRSSLSAAGVVAALPVATLAVMISLIASRPLGMSIQKNYTVDSDLGDLRITSIQPINPSLVTRLFQLLLGQAKNKQVKSYRVETKG